MPDIQIMPSILAADFGRLAEDCQRVEQAGADQVHVDVMDGIFVPNITFGSGVLEMVAGAVQIPRNVHLMVWEPLRHIETFAKAGADTILIHLEARGDVREAVVGIRSFGKRAGVTLNPETPAESIFPFLDERLVDEVLIMSVHPGFGGQKYMASVEKKAALIRERALWVDIAVDGGIDGQTVVSAAAHGMNLFVAGSYLFKQEDMASAIADLRRKAEENYCVAL